MNTKIETQGFELSENQKNLWNLGNAGIFFNQIKIELKNNVEREELFKTISKVITSNEILNFKTCFNEGFTYPIQFNSAENGLEFFDITYDKESFDYEAKEKLNYNYDSSLNSAIRFCFVNEADNVKFVYIRIYSLWSDSYSLKLFCEQLFNEMNSENIAEDVENEIIDYSGFSSWQNELINDPEPEAKLFWEKYDFDIKKGVIPYQKKSPQSFKPQKAQICKIENEDYFKQINFCKENKIDEESFFLYPFLRFLFLFDKNEISIGYISSKRKYKELNNTLGYVNTIVPLVFDDISNFPADKATNYIQKKIDDISDWTDFFTLERENINTKEYYFKYNYEFIDLSEFKKENFLFDIKDLYLIQDSFDVKLSCANHGDYFSVDLYFNEEVFGEVELNILKSQVNKYYKALFTQNNSNNELSELENSIVLDSNNTNKSFKSYTSIIELFNSQVENAPDNIALINENLQMSYRELDLKSDQFKNCLIEKYDVNKGDAVCFLGNATEWYIISILGILKAGAYYIPIDANYPVNRINYIVEESKSKVLICDPSLLIVPNVDYITFIPTDSDILKYAKSNFEIEFSTNDTAYCIYTSGSTGNPKGCIISQSNLLNYIQWANTYYFENANTGNWALFTSISFDLSVTALFTCLTRGKKLWISNFEEEINVLLKDSFSNPEIDTLKITPAHISLLKDLEIKNSHIKRIICGGEKLLKYQLDILKNVNQDIKVYNEYGPTEATVGCIVSEVSKNENNIVIGKPIANTQIYILNEILEPCHIGETGEIFIGGASLSQGYLNREDLSKEKFVSNPFNSNENIYRTGDLACWLSDGTIEYFGRKDFQVKIRGYRIELGDIENIIMQFSTSFHNVIVDVSEKSDDKLLIAYLVADENVDKDKLRDFLTEKLPNYMIPNYFVDIQQLPLTTNGKIDRKALNDLNYKNILKNEYVAPSNEIQRKVVEIWQDLLGKEKIGIKDNFIDLGGHSLIAVQIFNRVYKELGKSISIKSFFENPTIEALVEQLKENEYISIERASPSESYPITPSQYRFWTLSRFKEASLAYNMPTTVRFKGELDVIKLEESFRVLINRHEILRTSFKFEGEDVRQFITPSEDVNFKINHVNFNLNNSSEKDISAYLFSQTNTPFDLEKAPLVRASLLKIQNNEHLFFVLMHHIIGDGWSMELLLIEIVKIYNSLVLGKEIDLPKLKIQYKDYAVWLNNEVQQKKFKASEEYWLNQFAGEIPAIELPSLKKRPLIKTYNGDSVSYKFTKEFTGRLNAFSIKHDVTLFMTLMAGMNYLLCRYTGQEDIIIGTPIAGREHPDLENQIGLYLNTLALRTRIDKEFSFLELLNYEKELILGAYENQNYSFDELIDKLHLKRENSRSALFDIIIELQNQNKLNNFKNEELINLEVSGYKLSNKTSKFDLVFSFIETDALLLEITYNTDIYDKFFVERIFSHFELLVSGLIAQPESKIRNIDYLSRAEKDQLLIDFNNTAIAYPRDKTIIDLFDLQTEKTPANVAIVFGDKEFTYKQLNDLSTKLSYSLQKDYGIEKGDIVGVQLGRNEWSIISILGILKAGGVYIPIDSELPHNRKAFIVEDTNFKLLITETAFIFDLDFYQGNILSIDVEFDPSDNIVSIQKDQLSSNDLAYIIYTSGSTGNPKGVMVEHSSLTNYLVWAKEYYLTDDLANTNFGLFTSLSFDLTITSMFLPLISGGRLKISESDNSILDLLKKYFESEISCIKLTPAHISILDGLDLKSNKIELAIVGGEELRKNHIAILKSINPSIKIFNEYGPTETTVGCTIYEVKSEEETVLIGRPIANTSIYIVDEFNNLQAEGITGEICIGGSGLARGYLNRSDLTAEKFILNPFKSGARIYKTGDLGKWLPDGNIEYKGRIDDQVKIRGHRIELGEIEMTLLQTNKNLKQALVEVKEVNGEKALVVYYLSGVEIDKSELRSNLVNKLPDYMIPSFYIKLDYIPLTSNGKIDRKSLPHITDEDIIKKEYVAPENETEQKLVEIWQKILKIERIGTMDNFFELGGHSITAIKIIAEVQKNFNVMIDMVNIFQDSTIKVLAEKIVNQVWYENNVLEEEITDKVIV